ncbi:microcystin-dependent protein [Paraburkholderia sp. BL23I1N1]|uniref:phage tail protein n=1 Tax=Paraburkholderia sp. BL23I1N1 TaxID=1938802 RepID=UPI000E72DD4C|nr:tail fiber protein [Paraburkholderia sp. BL23I1N1]RKE25171.1 microcystin-dependent protein [Paraburkholderia sp. BL23I1N1]
MSDPFLGEIRMAGFNFAPRGWAQCQGQLMPISQNQALFSLLGTFFGGNGVSNYQLPDLQGRSPVGMGQGLGLSPIDIGETGGTENASLTIENLPQHTHTATVSGGAGTASIAIPASTSTASGTQTAAPSNTSVLGPISAGGRPGEIYSTATADTTLKPFNATLSGTAPTVQNSMTGSSLPFSLRNPYLGINFIIALQGVFPPRG